MFTLSKKKAFTLAEILITLGIIGVISAMTIPALLADISTRKMETKFKKAYAQLNEMHKRYLAENDMAIPVGVRSGDYMSKIFPRYLKGFSNVNNDMWNTKDDKGEYSTEIYNKYKNFKDGTVKQLCDVSGAFADINGILYMWNDSPAEGENGPIICVDLNGTEKPNIVGIDYFLFIPTVDGTVIPMGMEDANNSQSTSCGGNCFLDNSYCGSEKNNYSCAYWAVIDKAPNGKGRYWKDYIKNRKF